MDRLKARASAWMRRMLGGLAEDAARSLAQLGHRLGRPALATVPVSAVMLSRVETVSAEQSLAEVAQRLVAGRHVHLPIVDGDSPIGVVTRDDVAAGLERSGPHAPVGEAPRHDVITVTPTDSFAEVLDRLRHAPESVALVVDFGRPVGLLTVDRLVAYAEQARRAG